jgi:DNA-binding transcriptional ArsR family regulator
MSFPERPLPLAPYICEKIDAELHKFDELYWPKITAFRVKMYYAPDEPVPPQRPQHLLHEIEWYAERLFKAEADYYEQLRSDIQYGSWLDGLANRVRARVLKNLDTLESSVSGTMILGYHGLTKPRIEEHLMLTLSKYRLQYEQGIADSQRGAATSHHLLNVPNQSGSPKASEPLAEQIKRLKDECDITAEEIAEALGVVPRSIWKHLAGTTVPRRGHLVAYERLFTERLGRSVTFQKVSKKSQKGHSKGS